MIRTLLDYWWVCLWVPDGPSLVLFFRRTLRWMEERGGMVVHYRAGGGRALWREEGEMKVSDQCNNDIWTLIVLLLLWIKADIIIIMLLHFVFMHKKKRLHTHHFIPHGKTLKTFLIKNTPNTKTLSHHHKFHQWKKKNESFWTNKWQILIIINNYLYLQTDDLKLKE